MSFSGTIKEELSKHYKDARHCQLAELSAIMQMCGEFSRDEEGRHTLYIDAKNI